MKILFDQGTPHPLRLHLFGHAVTTVYELGWNRLTNGNLILTAEQEGFDLLVATDQNLKYQQNLTRRKIAIVVLLTTSWPRLQKATRQIAATVAAISTGDYVEVTA